MAARGWLWDGSRQGVAEDPAKATKILEIPLLGVCRRDVGHRGRNRTSVAAGQGSGDHAALLTLLSLLVLGSVWLTCRSEYLGGFRRGLLISQGTDSVRTNLAAGRGDRGGQGWRGGKKRKGEAVKAHVGEHQQPPGAPGFGQHEHFPTQCHHPLPRSRPRSRLRASHSQQGPFRSV